MVTGNGTFDVEKGGTGYGESVVKLSPTLGVVDWFTPHDADTLIAADLDLLAGALLVPSLEVAVTGGKAGVAYVVDMKNLGHWQMNDDSQILQSLQVGGAIHGSPIVWDRPSAPRIYLWGAHGQLQAYDWQGTTFQPASQSAAVATWSPGGILSLSANGATPGTGIVWATHPISGDANHAVVPGVLQAFDAEDLTKLLWDSQMNAARDAFGNYAKFTPPTVANGRVYLATFSNELAVYGLLGP